MKRYIVVLLFVVTLTGSSLAQVPASNHVFIVLEENHSYSDVTSASMPYLTSLAAKYGLATNYYASTHPSIGNYFMLTTGQIITNDDTYSSTVTVDNIARHLLSAGKTFKEYSESIPYAGYTGGDAYPYVQHHNPLSYFSDVRNSSIANSVLVPFTQLAADISTSQLPNYGFIVPNNLDNAHDGTLQTADTWLQNNIAPLIASSQFQQDGILVVVFDEAATTDSTDGGGHVFMAVIGPGVNKGLQSTTFYQHQSTLRMMMAALGMSTFPGAAQSAPDMGEFFAAQAPPPSSPPPPPPSPPQMSMAISPASATVTAGGVANFQITITPTSGTVGSASLACGNLPTGVSCSFNPAVVSPGTSPVTVTLTLSTTGAISSLRHHLPHMGFPVAFAPVFGLIGIGAARERRRRNLALAAAVFVLAMAMLLQGCGGAFKNAQSAGASGATPAGNYSITVTATAGSSQTSATAALTVH